MRQALDGTTAPLVETDTSNGTQTPYVRLDQGIPKTPTIRPEGGGGAMVPIGVSDAAVLCALQRLTAMVEVQNELLEQLLS